MKTPFKVRLFNFFRNIFRISVLESLLANLTRGKSSNHFFSKFVPNPYQYNPGTIRNLRYHDVNMRVDISDYIGHYLFFGFSDVGIDKLFSLCDENSKVLDVGANIGWTVLNLARIAKHGKVLGFEPDPYNFDRCRENITLNNFENVNVFPVGLGNKNDRVNMEVRTPSNRGGNRIAPSNSQDARPVDIVKLDDFAPVKELGGVDLIKMDVEGYELNALRGAEQLLRKYKPILFIELDDNNLKDQGDSAHALIRFLLEIGYQQIEHAENKLQLSETTDFSNCHFDIIAR
jgi:FkbM family methyltransferase